MSQTEYSPRLSIRISPELAECLNEAIPWGLKNALFVKLSEDLVQMAVEGGPDLLYLYLRGNLKLSFTEEGT